MSFNLPGGSREREIFNTQVLILDTVEFLGIPLTCSPEERCVYVEHLLKETDYPITGLPWERRKEFELNRQGPEFSLVRAKDVSVFYLELRACLISMGYLGEELLVSPSKGTLVIIHYYKGQS